MKASSTSIYALTIGGWVLMIPRLVEAFRPVTPCLSSIGASWRTHLAESARDTPTAYPDGPLPPPQVTGVVAPLTHHGVYPCLSLQFPQLPSQPVWDFVVDTGANVNTIQQTLVEQYNLTLTSGVPAPSLTAGMGGSIGTRKGASWHNSAGDGAVSNMVDLGDSVLAGLPVDQQHVVFCRRLTAAALPHASPVDGLLGSSSFISMFGGGVEFDWYGTDGDPPTFCFYFAQPDPVVTRGMTIRVPLQQVMGLFVVTIQINEQTMTALLDTGSPITVLTPEAAQTANIPVHTRDQFTSPDFDQRLVVGGVDGHRLSVQRSADNVTIQLSDGSGEFTLGHGSVYIGSIPALDLLQQVLDKTNQTEETSRQAPVAILGLDFLRQTYRMLLRTNPCELWLEELDQSKPMYHSSK